MNQGRAFLQGVGGMGRRLEDLVGRPNAFEGVLGPRPALRQNNGDGLAHVPRLALRQGDGVMRPERGMGNGDGVFLPRRPQVFGGERGRGPGLQGPRDIDGFDPGMGVGRPEEGRVQGAGIGQIVYVPAVPGQQPLVLDPRNARTEEAGIQKRACAHEGPLISDRGGRPPSPGRLRSSDSPCTGGCSPTIAHPAPRSAPPTAPPPPPDKLDSERLRTS